VIDLLAKVRYEVLPALLKGTTEWNTMAVRYETPHVDRCWVQWGEYRINLHKIYPCESPLFHPHPWPSAVEVYSGHYEMAIGHQHWFPFARKTPEAAATVVLAAGSKYEMLNPKGWHYVKPLGDPSMSVMITGKPWESAHRTPGKGVKHEFLPLERQLEVINFFRLVLSV